MIMKAELSPQVRSIARTTIFDWLKRLVSKETYAIDMNQAAHQSLDKLFEEGEISSQPPSNVSLEELSRHNIPENLVNFITQTFWELHLQGILSPTPAWVSTGNAAYNNGYKIVSAIITPYGRELLAEDSDRIRTHDPDGYLNNFYNANPSPDPEMMRYLSESISVFRSGHLLACVVLLGIASERLMTVLAESLRDALGNPAGIEWFQKKYRRDASKGFKEIINKLLAEYNKELEQEKLKEALQGIVTLSFEIIRHARNDIAHPKGREFTWNEVSGFLHSFVQYFMYINRITILLANNPK